MKKKILGMTLACAALCTLFSGCSKKNKNTWDDSKSASSYKYKNSQSLWGNDGSELADGEFDGGPGQEEFIALRDDDLKAQFSDGAVPQSRNAPGEPGSGIPGINQFNTPSADLAAIFRNIYFNTDEHTVRGKEALAAVDRVASYLKAHPNTYIFVAGHCDERGPEAYNLSLGARRANSIRSMLVQKGVDLNQIHTISYGKERPLELTHTPEAWSKNRRAEFKIYQK